MALTAASRPSTGLLSLAAELEGYSLMIAIAGSIANALEARRESAVKPEGLVAYLPEPLKAQAPQDAGGSARCEFGELSAAISTLTGRGAFLRSLAAALATSARDIALVADGLRRHASLCFVVRNMLARASGVTRSSSAPAGETKTVDDLLRAVSCGGSPCLDEAGDLSVPGLAERRHMGREKVSTIAAIDHRGRRVTCKVVNASSFGLGIVGLIAATSGDPVGIELSNGTLVSGAVAWVRGSRAGVILSEPLAAEEMELLRFVIKG